MTNILEHSFNIKSNDYTTADILISAVLSVREAMTKMSSLGIKELFVVDDQRRLIGALSDGDIRKWILKEGRLEDSIEQIYCRSPKFVYQSYRVDEVKNIMLDLKIECVPVVNQDHIVSDVLLWDKIFAGKIQKYKTKIELPVVIMAGGRGTRLDPFTKILPKSLIPIGEKPIIEVIMDKFYEHGVSHFYLSVNYKAKMIKSYFEDTNEKYKIDYIEEQEPLGTAGSLGLIRDSIEQTTIVTNCDVIVDCNYSELLQYHKSNKYDLTIVVSCCHHVIPYGVCEITNGGDLKTISEKPKLDLLINTGMYVLNADLLKLIPENQFYNINELIEDAQAKECKIGVFPISEESWIDVGQWEEYRKSVRHFNSKL